MFEFEFFKHKEKLKYLNFLMLELFCIVLFVVSSVCYVSVDA